MGLIEEVATGPKECEESCSFDESCSFEERWSWFGTCKTAEKLPVGED